MNRPNRGPHALLWSNALPISRRLLPNFIGPTLQSFSRCLEQTGAKKTTRARRSPLPHATARTAGLCRRAGPAAANRLERSGKRTPSCHPKAIKAGGSLVEGN
jgi:hypothetical protein